MWLSSWQRLALGSWPDRECCVCCGHARHTPTPLAAAAQLIPTPSHCIGAPHCISTCVRVHAPAAHSAVLGAARARKAAGLAGLIWEQHIIRGVGSSIPAEHTPSRGRSKKVEVDKWRRGGHCSQGGALCMHQAGGCQPGSCQRPHTPHLAALARVMRPGFDMLAMRKVVRHRHMQAVPVYLRAA